MGLIFSISNFFIIKTYQANNWSAKKIPSCAKLALEKPAQLDDVAIRHIRIVHSFPQLSPGQKEKGGARKGLKGPGLSSKLYSILRVLYHTAQHSLDGLAL